MSRQRVFPTIKRRGLQRNLHRRIVYANETNTFEGDLKRNGREFYVVVSGGEHHKIESGGFLTVYKEVIGKPRGYSESYHVSL